MWAIFVLDENIRCFIPLRRDRCTEKTLIQGTSPEKRVRMVHWTKRAIRKKLHFTDERHDLVAAIRKYGVFADGPALPFRDTGFWARNGVSLQGKASVSQNRLAIQTFGREKVCRGMGKQLNRRKPVRDTGFLAEKGVSLQGKASVSQNLLAIQTFGREMVCRGKKTVQCTKTRSRHRVLGRKWCIAARESLCFAKPARDTDFWTGKWCVAARKTVQCRKPVHDTGFLAENGVSLQGKVSVSQNLFAIQTFGRKMVCRGRENSSMHENPFTTQGF